jgi:hypothetical protein
VTLDGYVAIGDKSALAANAIPEGIYGGDYYAKDFTVRNSDIENQRIGIYATTFMDGTFTVENTYLRNATNIRIDTQGSPGSAPDGHSIPPCQVIISNDRFVAVNGSIGNDQAYDIFLHCWDQFGSANLIQLQTIMVYNYNQVAGDNFQLYYFQQAPDVIVPQSSGYLVGSPVAGLTNQQNWDLYGIAIAGAVCPTTNMRNGMYGYVRAF